MQKIEWNEDYCVGSKKIDDQHKKLFNWINALIEKKDMSVNSKIIINTLNELSNYASYHFDTEEKYMIQHNYPDYEAHKKEHENYKINIAKLSFGAMNRDESVPLELLKFLVKWWLDHLLETDLKLKPIFSDSE